MTPAPVASVQSSTEPFAFVGERLWLDFVNSEGTGGRSHDSRTDALDSFDLFMRWLTAAGVLDDERAAALARRAQQQPTGASAALHEARRVRNALRALAERGRPAVPGRDRGGEDRATQVAMAEINRVLGRSAGTRRVEPAPDGGFVRNFVTVGDVFAGLLIPVIESAADALVQGELVRVRRCADPRCARVFLDTSRNGKRRWCDMATCGNRAKAARHRRKVKVR
jgi:predicted RNA-binding Zn ribbon-like protein